MEQHVSLLQSKEHTPDTFRLVYIAVLMMVWLDVDHLGLIHISQRIILQPKDAVLMHCNDESHGLFYFLLTLLRYPKNDTGASQHAMLHTHAACPP